VTNSGTRRVALVAGGSGIVGHSVAMELKRHSWRVRVLARRPIIGVETITVDLINRDAIAAAVRPANDTTHLFYAALSPDSDLSVAAERNGQMLGNLLDGLNTVGAPLRRVSFNP
jgi:nucleoside-diphosphate-sugar epimerase